MRQSSDTNALSTGSVILIGAFFLAAVMTYALNILLGWLLSPAGYGMFGVAQAIMMIMMLFITSAFPLTVAKFWAEPERQDKGIVFRSSLIANLVVGIVLCLVLYIIYTLGLLPLAAQYQPLLMAVIVAILLSAVGGIYQGSLQGLFRFKEWAVIICVQVACLLLFATILVLLGFGPAGAMAGYPISAFVILVLYIYFTRNQKFWGSGSWIDKEVYGYAMPMFLGVAGAQLLMNIDIIGLKFFTAGMSDVMAGYYRACLVWARIPVSLIIVIMGAFLPFISRYSNDKEMVRFYSTKVMKYAFIFILPLSLAMIIVPESFITLMFPESYIVGAKALPILSTGMFFLVLAYICASVFQGTGRPRIPAFILAGAVAIQIICLYFLVPRYNLIGTAISTASSCIIGFLLLQYTYLRYYGLVFNIIDVGKMLFASIVFLAILHFFPMPSRLLIVLGLACGFVVFLTLLSLLKILHYTDVDMILSGVFSKENKFKAKAIGFVKALNREP